MAEETAITRSPAVIKYPGAKWTLAPAIIKHFPPHYWEAKFAVERWQREHSNGSAGGSDAS